jgi:hypothetical protein
MHKISICFVHDPLLILHKYSLHGSPASTRLPQKTPTHLPTLQPPKWWDYACTRCTGVSRPSSRILAPSPRCRWRPNSTSPPAFLQRPSIENMGLSARYHHVCCLSPAAGALTPYNSVDDHATPTLMPPHTNG